MYQEIEYRLYRYVVAVAKELSFSRASEQLHLSQPSLSKQIRDLEEMLGTPLFERTKRYVRLTEAGDLFVEKAREVIRAHEQANHAIKTFSPSNRFSVGCSPWVNQEILQSIRTSFDVQSPNVKVRTLSEFTPIQLPLLKSGLLDAALVILPLEDASLNYEVLLREPLLAALPAQHPLARHRVWASPQTRGLWPIRPETIVLHYIRPAAKKAGIKKQIGWHTFRHSLSSLLRSNGEDIKVVQELLRHANSKITLDIYTQALSPNKREAQSKVVRMILDKQKAPCNGALNSGG